MTDELQTLLTACAHHTGDAPDADLRAASSALFRAAQHDPGLFERAADALATLPPHGAAWLAMLLGANVENRRDAATGPAVLGVFRDWLERLPCDPDDDDEPATPTPEQDQLLLALPQFAPSLVSHLAAQPEWRDTLAHDTALRDAIDARIGQSHALSWVREALRRTSGTLIVLHAPSRRGLRVRYKHVGNNFHLFTLLQGAIGTTLPGGRAPDATAVSDARGQSRASEGDEAWWHYGDPRVPRADITASIWGEGDVRDLPRIDGETVIVLWHPILQSRHWDEGFFHPQIAQFPPDASIDAVLSPNQALDWLARLGIERIA